MEIVKAASETVADVNDVITYTITLQVSNGVSSSVVVTDVLPKYLTWVSFGAVPAGGTSSNTGNNLTWNFPTLAPGTYSFTYQAQVASYVPGGTVLTNNAQVVYAGNPTPKKTSVNINMAISYTVKIGVYNAAGELIKQISVQELSQQILSIQLLQTPTITSLHGVVYVDVHGQQVATWDGTNSNGQPVSNGEYYIKVDNIDSHGVDTSVTETVTVNRGIAQVVVDIYNSAGEIVRHLYSYEDDPGNTSLTDVELSTSVLKPTVGGSGSDSVVYITSPTGMSLTWNGTADNGAIVSNGRYMIEVHWTDGKGNESTITRGITVETGNSQVGTVVAAPNILTSGITSTSIQVNSPAMPYTLTARLYDLAGELIKVSQGQTEANQTTLNVAGLSSGVYFVVVDLVDANGGLAGRQTTQILIRH